MEMLMIRLTPATRTVAAAAVLLALLIPTSPAQAQEVVKVETRAAPLTLTQSAIEHAKKAALESTPSPQGPVTRVQAPPRERSTTRKIVGALLGGTAGFFAGGYLGAAIDGDCGGCDDPGFMGAIIGAPIGAAVGGILGAVFF
jgi:hypothetical protein